MKQKNVKQDMKQHRHAHNEQIILHINLVQEVTLPAIFSTQTDLLVLRLLALKPYIWP